MVKQKVVVVIYDVNISTGSTCKGCLNFEILIPIFWNTNSNFLHYAYLGKNDKQFKSLLSTMLYT